MNTWIDRLFARIEAQYPGRFYASFPEDPDGVNRKLALARAEWANSIRGKCGDPEMLGEVLRRAVAMLPSLCRYPPVLADVLGAIDEAMNQIRPPTKHPMYQEWPKLRPGSGVAGVIEHLGKSANSEAAQTELKKIRGILSGEKSVEEATGKAREQHYRFLTTGEYD